jgi:serine/threonine protein kinase
MERMPLAPGTWLGELEFLRVLAVGGFGIVYLARDHSLDRDVAVKEFAPPHLARRGEDLSLTVRSNADAQAYACSLRSFIDEAKLLARFSHSSIVKIYRVWEANGTAYIMMPYLPGPTLGDVRRSMSEPPTEIWLRSIVDPLLDALQLLHGNGICHRDISPENIVLAQDSSPVLLDFGAARLVGDDSRSITAIIKPCYAPIEQYSETEQLQQGPWTDLYALGALVTYLVDGAPPPASTARCVDDQLAPLSNRRIPGVSTRFLSAMDWALALKPGDRPQSVAELQNAMQGVRNARSLQLIRRAGNRQFSSGATVANSAPLDAGRQIDATVVTTPVRAKLSTRENRPAHALRSAVACVCVLLALGWTVNRLSVAQSTNVSSAAQTQASATASQQPPAIPVLANFSDRAAPQQSTVLVQAEQTPPSPQLFASRTLSHSRRAVSEDKVQHARKRVAQDRYASLMDTRPVQRGPLEICSSRNFFMRPYCVQRQCNDPRFVNSAECKQLRPIARGQL